jgi:hypothetical protein
MNDHDPPLEHWQLKLLADVDGEPLPEKGAEPREHSDPEILSLEERELRSELESLSPCNTPFWDDVRPPEPDPVRVELVRSGLHEILPRHASALPDSSGKIRWRRILASLTATAAAVLIGSLAWPEDELSPLSLNFILPAAYESRSMDPLFAYTDLPIATADEVMISSIRGNAEPILLACEYPLPGPLALAAAHEITLDSQTIAAAESWTLSLPAPEDAPILTLAEGPE